jgi:hypothetical protein
MNERSCNPAAHVIAAAKSSCDPSRHPYAAPLPPPAAAHNATDHLAPAAGHPGALQHAAAEGEGQHSPRCAGTPQRLGPDHPSQNRNSAAVHDSLCGQ